MLHKNNTQILVFGLALPPFDHALVVGEISQSEF
jgi:hypothetical protein